MTDAGLWDGSATYARSHRRHIVCGPPNGSSAHSAANCYDLTLHSRPPIARWAGHGDGDCRWRNSHGSVRGRTHAIRDGYCSRHVYS